MGTNCFLLIYSLFLYSYETLSCIGLHMINGKKLALSFNFTFRYIDDALSLHNSKFCDYFDHIYPIELEMKYTIDTTNAYHH
jgi:hypothetical protein